MAVYSERRGNTFSPNGFSIGSSRHLRRAVDLALDAGVYAYDAYVLEAARASAYPLLTLDSSLAAHARNMQLAVVELSQ